MSSESYVENYNIILPVLKDGVTRLGDLWDCQESKYIGENLFKQYLDGEYITTSRIQDDEFRLIHCKNTSDKIKTINVSGEISLELLAGLISVKEGSANYENDEKETKNREQLICHSRKEMFSVDALPKAKDLLDESVIDKILSKTLKATHFVRSLTLGAEVKADIYITQDENRSKSDIKGDFIGHIKLLNGPINASLKASLSFLDSENNTNFKKEISVHSTPAMTANPKSIEEMFDLIENINTTVNEHKHFPKSSDKVIGVPIRFFLVPIKQFLNFNVEKLYYNLSNKVMSDLNELLVRVQDIQVPGHISRKLLEMNSSLAVILFDNESKLSVEVKNYEIKLREIGIKYFEESVKTLKRYKIKNANIEDLLEIINKFQQECNFGKIFEQAVEFKNEGEDTESSKSYFHILTNENSLKQFSIDDKDVKIWLHTNDKIPDGVFLRLDEMVESLSKIDIKVGIAVKSISSKFQLNVKVREKENIYDNVEEIPYILTLIEATVGIGFDNELLFHSMNAEMLNMKLPLKSQDEVFDMNNLIEKCKVLKDVIIARSYLETLALLTRNDDKWKFFMPIDAKQTSFQALRNLYDLTLLFKDVDWVVGNLNITKSFESGFLFLIKNSKVEAVCLDDLDLILLREKFNNMYDDVISILSPSNMKNSFYPGRAQSSEAVIKAIEFPLHKNLNICEYGLESFKENPNEELIQSLELAFCLSSNKSISIIATIAKFAIQENNELLEILSKAGYSSTDNEFHNQILNEKNKQSLIHSIEEIIANQSPLSFKINIAIQAMNTVIEAQEDLQKYENSVSQVLDKLMTDQNCTVELKNNICAYNNIGLKSRCTQIKLVLEKHENKQANGDQLFHTKMLHSVLINDCEYHFNDTLKKYINRISLKENIFGSLKENCLEDLENKHYNKIILKLSECSFGTKYSILHKGLQNYCGSDNSITALVSLLDQLTDNEYFNESHWQEIWKNNRFEYIIRSVIGDSRIIDKLLQMGCQDQVPHYIPKDIAQKIDKSRQKDTDFELPELFKSFDEFLETLQEIRNRSRVPEKFRRVLIDSIEKYHLLYEKLEELGLLEIFKWNSKHKVFPHAIEIDIIIKAVDMIEKIQNSNYIKDSIDVNPMNMDFNHEQTIEETNIRNRVNIVNENYVSVYGNSISLIDYQEFVTLNSILKKPLLEPQSLQHCVVKILPYIIQKMKMWGCNASSADNISSLIANKPESKENNETLSTTKNKPRFGNKTKNSETQKEQKPLDTPKTEVIVKIPFSRLDTITGVVNSMDPIVSQDILNIMAKFPIALPLIVRNLNDGISYKNLMPWLTKPTIKWESSPGKIIENHLFIDEFKLIVCLRIGKTSDGKSGKSTLLNQLLSGKYIFSCCGEPGANRGIPVTLNGSVEFVYLTQETASPKLWESVLQKHYESGVNEIILLANVHGNALDFENHLKFLKTIASSYIFFIMPDDNENVDESWSKLEEILEIGEKDNTTFYVAIDPPLDKKENYTDNLIMETSRIFDDSNIEILRNVLKNCLTNPGKKVDVRAVQSYGETKITEQIETEESRALIKFIEQNSCKSVKKTMSLQRTDKKHKQCVEEWSKNDQLKKVIRLMGDVLLLNNESRLKALIHIEKEMNRISAKESSLARQNYYKCSDQLQKTIGASGNDKTIVIQLKKRVKEALDEIDQMNLGLEHFYREIGKLYEIILANDPLNNPYRELAKRYAELFIGGQAIELLDGDSGEILGPWISAIFDYVYRKFPGMRIFVISILGLQSSGKSTLLNAMFACKFAVSVGRCTRGLFMRLLFLDEHMKEKLNFDAILLIDTEGLGAPEKQNEPDAERKDRIMATFAMGISHLTLVNVLGEYMRDLTEILQIAIVAMARLEKADIAPDILMVQHLTERNSDKMTNASKQFGDALEKAINIADEKDVDFGIRDSKCLNTLRQTISTGNLFRQFRPFKNGASVFSPPSDEYHQDVVELYNSIINTAQNSENKADLKNWQILINSYWESIKEENFMRFKDVKDLQEHCMRGEMIAKFKESAETAFRVHSGTLKSFIKEQAKKLNKHEVTREIFLTILKDKLQVIPTNCISVPPCEKCKDCIKMQSKLYDFVAKKPSEHDTRVTVHKFITKTRDWHFNQLSQMMSAEAIRQVESAGTLDKIEKRLKNLLNNNKSFSESEIKSLQKEIWREIEKDAADRVTQIPIFDQISNEIPRVYQERPEFIMNLKDNPIRTLKGISAIDRNLIQKGVKLVTGGSNLLETNQVYDLEDKIIGLSEIILKEDNAQNYQTGMIAKLKKKVENIIRDFEKKYDLKLKSDFKWILHSFANKKFYHNMFIKQQKWDEDNNPLTILRKNKSQYIEVITERLRHGFSYDSEGLIVGKSLLVAIKQKTLEVVNDQIIYDVLSNAWLSNSETVRLEYFSELVEEVKNNNFHRALNHFDDPKTQIENWFVQKVNKTSEEKEFDKFMEILTSELNRVKQDIEGFSSINEIKNYIETKFITCDEIKLDKNLDPTKANKTEIEIFKNRILEVLNIVEQSPNLREEIRFISPSHEKRVMDRMGCSFACPLCAGLCWGQRDHDEEEGDSSKHHTCHQPMGLSKVHLHGINKLMSESCDYDTNDKRIWKLEERDITWGEMKRLDRYKNWKYETHVFKKFNDLMKWFFFKLNEDIAQKHGYYPPDIDDKNKFDIHEGDIGAIMADINSRK